MTIPKEPEDRFSAAEIEVLRTGLQEGNGIDPDFSWQNNLFNRILKIQPSKRPNAKIRYYPYQYCKSFEWNDIIGKLIRVSNNNRFILILKKDNTFVWIYIGDIISFNAWIVSYVCFHGVGERMEQDQF